MRKLLIVLMLISIAGCSNEPAGTSGKPNSEESQKARLEMTALTEKQETAAAAREKLNAFRVTRSRFYIHKEESGPDQPIVELDITNDTEYPVSKAHFIGLLAVPGKAKPRYAGAFSSELPGGLDPGESAHWNIAIDSDNYWAGVTTVPEGGVFMVEVTGLEGPGGEPLYPSDFSEEDAKRLSELHAKYPE